MPGDDKNGYYCSICGGIPPDRITTKRILIDGKETGIDHLDFILDEVKKLRLENSTEISDELLKRVKVFNYVPTKKTAEYAAALVAEYQRFLAAQ
ncbi:MAG: NAC family transcription factor [Methanomicrobiales archaeon]